MELLKRYFDTALDAPDGIEKLRKLILSLAMRGRLVKQDSREQSAHELLIELKAETQELEGKEKRKSKKILPSVKVEEMPFDLPLGWEWCYLGEIGTTNVGLTYSPSDISDVGTPVLRSSNVQNGQLDFSDLKRVAKAIKESVLVHEGDLLICARNGSKALVGKTALITGLSEDMAFGAFMAIFRSRINNYLLYFINSSLFRDMIDSVNTMTINQITQKNLRSTIFPLPPLAEQRRIVVKIDQLMARCDELEKLRAERDRLQVTVHKVACDRLLTAQDPDTFTQSWQFITQHFSELYSVKENVAELRKVILQIAVMGKLVPQNLSDKPASELIAEIDLEKQRMVEEKKIKKQKTTPAISVEKLPHPLPRSWKWINFGSLVLDYQNGISKRRASVGEDTIVLRLADITRNEVSLTQTRSIPLTENERSKYLLREGELLITRVNGSIDLVGSFIRMRNNEFPVAYCDHFIRIRLPLEKVDVDYVHLIARSPFLRQQIENKFVTTAGQKTVNQTHISTLIFPLPPLSEQHRIVAKVDQLMTLCDQLEQQIDKATQKQTALLNAVINQI